MTFSHERLLSKVCWLVLLNQAENYETCLQGRVGPKFIKYMSTCMSMMPCRQQMTYKVRIIFLARSNHYYSQKPTYYVFMYVFWHLKLNPQCYNSKFWSSWYTMSYKNDALRWKSLRHGPTYCLLCLWRIEIFSMNNATRMGLKLTKFAALLAAHRAINLRHGGLRTWQNRAGI